MNETSINTIFFDIGATLRVVVKDEAFSRAAEEELMQVVHATTDHDTFFAALEENWHKYRKNAKSSLLDVSEMELWTKWLLKDYPPTLIAKNASTLTRLWRDHDGRRVARPGVKETIIELYERGYRLGIIANTITEWEIPNWLVQDELVQYFQSVILSSKVRLRKPDPAIYLLAARTVGSLPENCAYIGDNARRDVEGTFDAGYGMMIRIIDPTRKQETASTRHTPHHLITEIPALLEIFPPLNSQKNT